MEVTEGSCRIGLWHVHVTFTDNIVHRIRFHKTPIFGPVPIPITRYLAGKTMSLDPLYSRVIEQEGKYGEIYRIVQTIPYGSFRTYGQVAKLADTNARVVGLAMMRNMTPLIVPCHRVVAARGIGGYTPDVWIKEELLKIETEVVTRMKHNGSYLHDDITNTH